jgi:hypothetical protein
MQHSTIVGGSTAKRVMRCPGSVALVATMPPKPSSSYADEGTLLHDAIARYLGERVALHDLGLSDDLLDRKLVPALEALEAIDPEREMEIEVETRVSFGSQLPGVFGSTDVLGRIKDRAIVLDWKFGDGVPVDAAENEQLMFYGAAALRTQGLEWWHLGADEVELIIVQPPHVRRWVTDFRRLQTFNRDLIKAVKIAKKPDAPLAAGDWCRWCAAKPVCPVMTGATDRALAAKMDNLDAAKIGEYLQKADMLEGWVKDLRALAHQMLEAGKPVPGYKLVPKRATRQWTDQEAAYTALTALGLTDDDVWEPAELLSPPKVEKILKKLKLALPADVVVSVSSGTTMASEDDPRPAVGISSDRMRAALTKLG